MIDDATLAAWDADSHHSQGCVSCQRIIREAIAYRQFKATHNLKEGV